MQWPELVHNVLALSKNRIDDFTMGWTTNGIPMSKKSNRQIVKPFVYLTRLNIP